MKLSFIGTGYVGLISGVCLSNLGNKVICLDVNEEKINMLKKGISPIYEPGIEELILKNLKNNNLEFTTNKEKAVNESEIIFIAVGTPQDKNGEADLKYVKEAAKFIGEHINEYKIIVDKSTVPIGTTDLVTEIIKEQLKKRGKEIEFDVVSNPEFLAEGSAVNDFAFERIVIGSNSTKATKKMVELYTIGYNQEKKILTTDTKSAEIIKYASNTMLALRLSFINEVSELCEKVGADIETVSEGMGADPRIGNKFLKASLGYGGSCFPKDIKAFKHTMIQNNCETKIIPQIDEVNQMQLKRTVKKTEDILKDFKGKTICILGLAFKANTDDIRESQAIKATQEFLQKGAKIKAFDPKAIENSKKCLLGAEFFSDIYSAAKGADLIFIGTEWKDFKEMDLNKIKSILKHPNIVDGRNLFDPKKMKEMGFNYKSIGRN
jgi:UDPglucose 6-dehydrogenase